MARPSRPPSPPGSREKTERRIAFAAAEEETSQAAVERLRSRYGDAPPDQADVIVAVGGDGLMLSALHANREANPPIYGMHRGSIGFLMNEFREERLHQRLDAAVAAKLHPLHVRIVDRNGEACESLAFNEVSLLRQTRQAAKISIHIGAEKRLDELIGDGVLLATPAGSTAYNFSAFGPILPIDAALLSLMPISPFRPRRWRGALLPQTALVAFKIHEADKRPVSAVADHAEFRHVIDVAVQQDVSQSRTLLFDSHRSLEERIVAEQFIA